MTNLLLTKEGDETKMIQKKIHPYLIDNKRLAGYFELLLESGFTLRIFDEKEDKELAQYFLPLVKDYLFWTFNLTTLKARKEFKSLSNDLKGAICATYKCNVFINKKGDVVICFSTGVCFAITDDDKMLKSLTKYMQGQKMQEVNIRNEDFYEFKDEKEEHQFAYILELYKMIYLMKINKKMQNSHSFDKVRNDFVKFTQEIYVIKETDKDKFCEKLKTDLKIESLYISVENQFDLLYKNNKLNENINTKRFVILLLAVGIIIGVINLINML